MPFDFLPVAIVAFIIICIVLFGIWNRKDMRKRTRVVEQFAKEQNLTYYPAELSGCSGFLITKANETYPSQEVVGLLKAFEPFNALPHKPATNVAVGESPQGTIYAFDCNYAEMRAGSLTDFKVGVMALRVPIDFEPIDFRPLSATDALETFLGMHGIEFESAGFNKRYFVTCENSKFAFDLVHPELIEFLMSVPGVRLQLGGPFIMASKEGYFESTELRDVKKLLERFVELIPDYVKQDRGFEPNWTSPFDLNQ